jgi:hypothetical protein
VASIPQKKQGREEKRSIQHDVFEQAAVGSDALVQTTGKQVIQETCQTSACKNYLFPSQYASNARQNARNLTPHLTCDVYPIAISSTIGTWSRPLSPALRPTSFRTHNTLSPPVKEMCFSGEYVCSLDEMVG